MPPRREQDRGAAHLSAMLRTPKALFLIFTSVAACLTSGLMVLSIMTGSAAGGAMKRGGALAGECGAHGATHLLAYCTQGDETGIGDFAYVRPAVARHS